MLPIEQLVLRTIEEHRLLAPGCHAVAAVSGGPDSICMLYLLKGIFPQITITGAYVDHNLRPAESPGEIELVDDHCRQLGIDFTSLAVDVPAEAARTGESIEACARRLRYDALENLRSASEADCIVVGHTADDQVEEILLRLIRGSGLKGLSGMIPRNGALIRPLLEVTKKQILDYLDSRGLKFCSDSSNLSDRFLRNRIRLELLPLLESRFNPSIRKTIRNTGNLLRLEEDYLSLEAQQIYQEISGTEPTVKVDEAETKTFSAAKLSAVHPALRRRIIERICWEMNSRPDHAAIITIDDLLCRGTTGTEVHLANRLRVVKQQDLLLFARLNKHRSPREKLAEPKCVDIEISEPGEYRFSGYEDGAVLSVDLIDRRVEPQAGLTVLDANLISFPLRLRSAEPGDRFKPLGGPGTRKVTRFYNDRKIPAHRRHRYPVLTSEGAIVCVVGLQIDDRYRVTDETRASLLISVDKDQC